MKWYGMFYDLEAEVRCESASENIYSLCGVDSNGKSLCMLTHYSEDDNTEPKEIALDFGKDAEYEIYLVDKDSDEALTKVKGAPKLTLPVHACALIKEI